MHKFSPFLPLFLCAFFLTLCQADERKSKTQSSNNADIFVLSPVYITSEANKLNSTTDTSFSSKDKALNSGDLAKAFTNLPGFSMTRKGGGGSEFLFRSQGASRVPVLLNGGVLSGGCGGRMDSGTAYIFPETYNDIRIFKGPQDVRFGALSFGGVLFDGKIQRFDAFSAAADVGFLYGSFNQIEATANAIAGNEFGSVQVFASKYASGDYKSADKEVVHSANKKEAISLIATLTPQYAQSFELRGDFSRGYAAYADRAMDARTFDRTSLNFRFNQELNFWLNLLDFRAWFNTTDHIMDNYTHRPNLTREYNLNNPKRTNIGARTELDFKITKNLGFGFGVDYNNDTHSSRNGSGTSESEADSSAFVKSYKKNYMAHHFGSFLQGQYFGIENSGLFFGARLDTLNKKRYANSWSKTELLPSGFLRYEHYFDNVTFYGGAGFASRGADFWELNKTGGEALHPEQNAQVDLGAAYQNSIFYLSASLFASSVKNYILIDWKKSSALQTNAALFGGELESELVLWKLLHLYGNVSYVYGENLKANDEYNLEARSPLSSIAPLQGNVSLYIESKSWLLRWDLHANAAQNRFAEGFGNVISKDIGATAGFYTMDIYGGYKHKNFSLFLGVENLTNTLYAYHLSKNSVEIVGTDNPISDKVFEPARSFWAKFKLNLNAFL